MWAAAIIAIHPIHPCGGPSVLWQRPRRISKLKSASVATTRDPPIPSPPLLRDYLYPKDIVFVFGLPLVIYLRSRHIYMYERKMDAKPPIWRVGFFPAFSFYLPTVWHEKRFMATLSSGSVGRATKSGGNFAPEERRVDDDGVIYGFRNLQQQE